MVFSLSEKLGGRTEVLNAPILETLGYLLMLRKENEEKAEQEEVKLWVDFLSRVHSHPLPEGATSEHKRNRQTFIDSIKPKERMESPKEYQWDFSQLEQMSAMQKGG